MSSTRRRLTWRHRLVWVLCAAEILWPLQGLTVYAADAAQTDQSPDIANTATTPTPAAPDTTTNTTAGIQDLPQVAAATLDGQGDHTLVYGTPDKTNLDDPFGVYVYPYLDTSPTQDDINFAQANPDLATAPSTGRLQNIGFATVKGVDDVTYWVGPTIGIDPNVSQDQTTASDRKTQTFGSVAADGTPTTDPSTGSAAGDLAAEDGPPIGSSIQKKMDATFQKITDVGAFDQRLVIKSAAGRAALFGEECVPGQPIDAASDVIVNGKCDNVPRIDARAIMLLDYLLKPRRLGGAGRDYLELSDLIQFSDAKQPNGVNAADSNSISTSMKVTAIDRIRITTRIKRTGLFGSSTKYKYQVPIPIQVAWQTNAGQAKSPLPAISTQEYIQQLGMQNLLDALQESDYLTDPSFAGRPLESIGLGDVARFMGGRLLKQMLGGADITDFNFSDTVKEFGVMAVAGALNIDPEILRTAKSIDDIQVAAGRAWISKQLGLPQMIKGDTVSALYQNIGQQQVAKLMGIKPSVFTNYQGADFKKQLGQGLLESRLPIPEGSFASDDIAAVKTALGYKFSLLFPKSNSADNQALWAEMDEKLGTPVGTTAAFAANNDVRAYKNAAGQIEWNNFIAQYSSVQPGSFVPLAPNSFISQLLAPNKGPTTGDITNLASKLVNSDGTINTFASLIEDPSVSQPERDALTAAVKDAAAQIQTITATLNTALSSIQGCDPTVRPCLEGEAQSSSATQRNQFVSQYLQGQSDIRLALRNMINQLTAAFTAAITIQPPAGAPGEPGLNASTNNSTGERDAKADLKGINDLTQNIIGSLDSYAQYGGNSDQSSQQIDKMWNLPGGTLFAVMGGGQAAQDAFVQAGIWTTSQYLSVGRDRDTFLTYAKAFLAGNNLAIFKPLDPSKQFITDVFFSSSPKTDLKRIGQRELLNSLSHSAEAQSVQQTSLYQQTFGTIDFYVTRYEAIEGALKTIQKESQNLIDLAANLPDTVSAQAKDALAQAKPITDLFAGLDPAKLTVSSAASFIKQNKNGIQGLKDKVNALATSVQDKTNAQADKIQNSINNLLSAARIIEQATNDMVEGHSTTMPVSAIPGSLTIPDLDLAPFSNKNGAPTCSTDKRQKNVLQTLFSQVSADNKTKGPDIWAQPAEIQKIFITLGATQLSTIMGLPMESFLYFTMQDDSQKSAGSFFQSVGRGVLMSQCQNPSGRSDSEMEALGRNYVAAFALKTIATTLGIKLPAWANENSIASLMMGNTDDFLLAIGDSETENRLGLPAGFVSRMVKPQGTTEEARNQDRQKTMIGAVLGQMGVELDLPPGFTITDDPAFGMGKARLEGVLGLRQGVLPADPKDGTASDLFTGYVKAIVDQATTDSQKNPASVIPAAVTIKDAEIAARTQLLNGLGAGVSKLAQLKQQSIDNLKKQLKLSGNTAVYLSVFNGMISNAQDSLLEILRADTTALTSPGFNSFIGSSNSNFTGDTSLMSAGDLSKEADSRFANFTRRLHYLDVRLGVDPGGKPDPTAGPHGGYGSQTVGAVENWLDGATKNGDFIHDVGGGAAEQLGTDAFFAFLQRAGIDGAWVDQLKSHDAHTPTGLSNMDLLKAVLKGDKPFDTTTLAQLWTFMGKTFSFDLDKQLGFEPGIFADLIANPGKADVVLFDQGVRLFAKDILNLDVDATQNKGATMKQLAQAMIYGASYNPATGRYEGLSVNGGANFNGDRAVLYGLGQLTQLTEERINKQIGVNSPEFVYFSVPLNIIYAAVNNQLGLAGYDATYVQLAQSQGNLRAEMNLYPNDTQLQQDARLAALGHHNGLIASGARQTQPVANGNPADPNSVFDVTALDTIITQGKKVNATAGLTQAETDALDQASMPGQQPLEGTSYLNGGPPPSTDFVQEVAAQDESVFTQFQHPLDRPNGATADAVSAADKKDQGVAQAQQWWQNTMEQSAKAAGFATMDYGLHKLLGLGPDVIKPGLSMTLFEGNMSAKTTALVGLGIDYLIKNVDIPNDLKWLVTYNNLTQLSSFFLNTDNRAQNLAAAFSAGGVFNSIQSNVLPHGIGGDVTLPAGTIGGLIGFMINGNTKDFAVNNVKVAGLSNLFNSKWLIEIGFNYIGKLLGVKSEVVQQAFQLGYNFYTAYQAWDALNTMNPADLFGNLDLGATAAQAANTEAAVKLAESSKITVEQAKDQIYQQKVDAANAQIIAAGIAIGVFVIQQVFGQELGAFEKSLGLPPGTITQALGLILTAIFVGTGPMFFASLGIFVLMTLFGFGFTQIRIRATADGYYPYVGLLGDETKKGDKGIPYTEYPSADAMSDAGTPDPSKALGEFDPNNSSQRSAGYQKAARAKVLGLIKDMMSIEVYAQAAGTYNSDLHERYTQMQPTQIRVQAINEGGKGPDGNVNYYLNQPQILQYNLRYISNGVQPCTKGNLSGICSPDPSSTASDGTVNAFDSLWNGVQITF